MANSSGLFKSNFSFGFEGWIRDLIASVPDLCIVVLLLTFRVLYVSSYMSRGPYGYHAK